MEADIALADTRVVGITLAGVAANKEYVTGYVLALILQRHFV